MQQFTLYEQALGLLILDADLVEAPVVIVITHPL